MCEWKVHYVVWKLVSFDRRHLTRFPPIRKRIWVGRYNNKQENSDFVSPRLSMFAEGNIEVEEKQNFLFPELSVLLYIPIRKRKKLRRSRLPDACWLTNLPRFQGPRPDHVQVQISSCCFPRELASFVRLRELVSFDPWHVTLIRNLVKLRGIIIPVDWFFKLQGKVQIRSLTHHVSVFKMPTGGTKEKFFTPSI